MCVCVCVIVVMANACMCVYTCVCVPVWTQCPACVAIEWSYGLCPVSILVLLLASECMAAPAGSGTITPPPSPPLAGSHNAPLRQHPSPWDRRPETGPLWVSHGYQHPEVLRGAEGNRKRGFLLRNMVRGSVCWISESCGQYYPISCDSLTEEMRGLWHRLKLLHWSPSPENIQLCPQGPSTLFGFLLNCTRKHTHACTHASGMFLYLKSIRASQNREGDVDIAERLRRYCWLLYSPANRDLMSSSHYEWTHTSTWQQTGSLDGKTGTHDKLGHLKNRLNTRSCRVANVNIQSY